MIKNKSYSHKLTTAHPMWKPLRCNNAYSRELTSLQTFVPENVSTLIMRNDASTLTLDIVLEPYNMLLTTTTPTPFLDFLDIVRAIFRCTKV